MSTLLYLILSIVFNILSSGINNSNTSEISFNHSLKVHKNQKYKVKDLKSRYIITEEELSQHLERIY
ncbi:MAG: hypothetical protein EVA38_01590 [Flavobacteriales bacterium]|nr:MAG: hypothetical protein EVA38_01590 [Flavobacteriales bacterium]